MQFMEVDWRYSVRLEYELDSKLISQAKGNGELSGIELVNKYLNECYTKIIGPMT